VFWRRSCGAAVMITGAMAAAASATVAAATLAGVELAWALEWAGAPFAMFNLAAVAAAGLAGGFLLTVCGRWIYGEWRDRAPVMRIVSLITQTVGAILASTMGGLFTVLLVTGVGPGDRQTAAELAGGMGAGFLVILLGWSLKPSRR
jgi:hypothetical protein